MVAVHMEIHSLFYNETGSLLGRLTAGAAGS